MHQPVRFEKPQRVFQTFAVEHHTTHDDYVVPTTLVIALLDPVVPGQIYYEGRWWHVVKPAVLVMKVSDRIDKTAIQSVLLRSNICHRQARTHMSRTKLLHVYPARLMLVNRCRKANASL